LSLKYNKVFITGGTSGIGAALAEYYLNQGATVAVTGRSRERFENRFDNHGKLIFYQVDVTDRAKMLEVMSEFCSDGIDLVIANAGFSHSRKTKIPSFDESDAIIKVNLLGVLYTFEGALQKMLDQKSGQLVAISSVAAYSGMPGTSAYSAAKAGAMKLCESYAVDLAPKGIDVTCIAPGWIDTPLAQANAHPMPFSVSVDKAVKEISGAIKKKKMIYVFPKPMEIIVKLLSYLPRRMFRWLMNNGPVNFSVE
jgi:short-subunit dehydrogenase